jgi:hypothetical protein
MAFDAILYMFGFSSLPELGGGITIEETGAQILSCAWEQAFSDVTGNPINRKQLGWPLASSRIFQFYHMVYLV